VSAPVSVFASVEEAAVACARRVEEVLAARLETAPRAAIAVSGGLTPKPMFEALRGAGLDWSRVHWFWVDERCVGPEAPDSNYRMTRAALLDPAGIPESSIHRIPGELPPAEAAEAYETTIREFFGVGAGRMPEFDLIHLGFGPEGHTGSLFPGDPLLEDRRRIAAAVRTPKPPPDRVTLLPGVILSARRIVVLGGGADKAKVVRQVLDGESDPMHAPVAMAMRAAGGPEWFLDRAAHPAPVGD
jgi:6-phosphogluconolactonase